MLYKPYPHLLGPSKVTCKQFPYISDASSVQGFFWNKGVLSPVDGGDQSAREFTSPGRTLKQWRIGVGGQITQDFFSLVRQYWSGFWAVSQGAPCRVKLQSSTVVDVIINTPFIIWPPFPVSLLLSLILFPGITFQKSNLHLNSWFRGYISEVLN